MRKRNCIMIGEKRTRFYFGKIKSIKWCLCVYENRARLDFMHIDTGFSIFQEELWNYPLNIIQEHGECKILFTKMHYHVYSEKELKSIQEYIKICFPRIILHHMIIEESGV